MNSRTMDETLFVRPETPSAWVKPRPGEFRIGERIAHYQGDLSVEQQLSQWAQQQIRFVLVGVAEDIGPRANLGQGGADMAWPALLQSLMNLQWHDALPVSEMALLGQIEVADLQTKADGLDPLSSDGLAQLRQLVDELDQRVQPAIEQIFRAGLIPIVIGGGHNNALPILRAYHQAKNHKAAVINLDPHADTRPCEGRHSGNPFSYGLQEGVLDRYAVVGLNPYRNSAATLEVFEQEQCNAFVCALSPTDGAVEQGVEQALGWLKSEQETVGVELDLDAIAMMPSSAQSPWGVTLGQAQHYIAQVGRRYHMSWLHLAEGAPGCHPSGKITGTRQVGDSLAALVLTALQCRCINCRS